MLPEGVKDKEKDAGVTKQQARIKMHSKPAVMIFIN